MRAVVGHITLWLGYFYFGTHFEFEMLDSVKLWKEFRTHLPQVQSSPPFGLFSIKPFQMPETAIVHSTYSFTLYAGSAHCWRQHLPAEDDPTSI